MTKTSPTPKRSDARARQKAHGVSLREWLSRDRTPPPVEVTRSGHGVTRLMQNIKPRPPEYLHKHTHAAGMTRRHKTDSNGARRTRGNRGLSAPASQPVQGAGHKIVRRGKSVLQVDPKQPTGPVRFTAEPLDGINTPYINPERDRQRVRNRKGAKLRPQAVVAAVLSSEEWAQIEALADQIIGSGEDRS